MFFVLFGVVVILVLLMFYGFVVRFDWFVVLFLGIKVVVLVVVV